ncbi:MAG: aldo/keto reductase [Cyanobacteria bacterium P01_A01_bin.135]
MATRRNFLLAAAGLTGTVACQRAVQDPDPLPQADLVSDRAALPVTIAAIPTRPLGNTGLSLPVLGLGGSASPLSRPGAEAEAIAIIERSLELGVRYFDTAANYGPSEVRLGKVLPAHREEVIIATKTAARDRDRAWRQLEQSLTRLGTDYIDVWQFHALTHDWDIDTILGPGGAILAAQEAQEQGIVKHLGVTGHHNPGIIAKALTDYPFGTALVPVNAADVHTPEPFITGVLPVAQRQGTGVIAMKVPAYGRLLKDGLLNMEEAMGYALSQPGVSTCIIAADDLAQLEANVAAANAFAQMDEAAIASIEARTANAWQNSSFFRAWG